MTTETHAVEYGSRKLQFTLRRRKRKTLAIHVHPDMSIEVVAPKDAPIEKIYEKVLKRGVWVAKQLRYFEQFHPKTPERLYVAGETHRYLGRQYRLKIVKDEEPGVKLVRGFITVRTPFPKRTALTKELLEDWYFERAKVKFRERLEHCLQLFPDPETVRPVGMIVRKLTSRWGSMSLAGRIVLNRRLVEAPIPCIDYVIVHELCHRVHDHHGPEFWRLLSRLMPDWNRRKTKLEQVMA